MYGFNTSLVEMHAASANVGDVGEALRSQLTSLGGEVESLVGSGWQGGAASAFGSGWTQWQQAAAECLAALETMSTLLRLSADGYGRAESDSQRVVQTAGG